MDCNQSMQERREGGGEGEKEMEERKRAHEHTNFTLKESEPNTATYM